MTVDPETRPLTRHEGFDREVLVCYETLDKESRRLTRNADEAQDLVQESYVKALRHAHHFRWGTSLRAWLLTILRHTAANRRRDLRRSRVDIDEARVGRSEETVQAPGDTPEEALLRKTVDPAAERGVRRAPTRLPSSGVAARRRGDDLCGDGGDAGYTAVVRPIRNQDFADLPRLAGTPVQLSGTMAHDAIVVSQLAAVRP